MKIKKIGSIVLTIVLVLTLFASAFSTLSVFADDTANKQMLRLTPTADGAKFGTKVSYDDLSAGEYIVQFKYKFTSGQLHNNFDDASSSAGAVFAVYSQLASGGNGAALTPIICTGWVGACTKTDLNANTVQYAFTITESHLSANLSAGYKNFIVGFYAPKSADFYIADMVMYRKDDTTKTNVLPDYLKGENWRYGFWFNQGFEGSGGSKNYDAALIGDNQMLNLKLNASVAQKIGIKVNKAQITAGNYTVQFKYKFTKGELATAYSGSAADSVTFAVYNNRKSTALQATMQYVVSDLGAGSKYSFNQLNSNTISYTFNITNSDINNCEDDYFYIGFFVNGAPEFYLADMVMYKSDDESKTNILPTSPNASDWKYGTYQSFYNGFTQIPGSKYLQYDADLFAEKQMLHLKTTENSRTGIKVHKDKLKPYTNYTVRFNYKFNQGNLVFGSSSLANSVQFAVFSNQFSNSLEQTRMQYVSSLVGAGVKYTYKNIDANTVEFVFNTDYYHEVTQDYYYIGLLGSKGTCDFYISDMVMYETADTEQTNLLPEELSSNWCNLVLGSGWTYNANKLPTGSAYMVYDETYFAEAEVTLGDGNGVEGIDIRDLVDLNNVLTCKIYNINYDMNNDGIIADADLSLLRNQILDINLIA